MSDLTVVFGIKEYVLTRAGGVHWKAANGTAGAPIKEASETVAAYIAHVEDRLSRYDEAVRLIEYAANQHGISNDLYKRLVAFLAAEPKEKP